MRVILFDPDKNPYQVFEVNENNFILEHDIPIIRCQLKGSFNIIEVKKEFRMYYKNIVLELYIQPYSLDVSSKEIVQAIVNQLRLIKINYE